ncbi:MAG: MFS transporter, partial [Pseudomonadota bacterium]
GILTDRVERISLMVRADSLRVLASLGIVALILALPDTALGQENAGWAYALAAFAFLTGTAEVLRDNAAQTVLPSIVSKPDLERANGQLWTAETVMGSFIGPPLAGALVAVSTAVPFALNTALYAISALVLRTVDAPPFVRGTRGSVLEEAVEGWRWLVAHVVILRIAVMLACMNAMAGMVMTMLVLLSQDAYGLDSVGYGLLLTMGAVGGVAGGLTAPRLLRLTGPNGGVLLALVAFPVCFLILGLANGLTIAGVALAVQMYASMLWNVVTVSYRQRLIPAELLGRVNSIYRLFAWGMIPVGALLGGAIVGALEQEMARDAAVRAPYFVAAAGSTLIWIYGLLRLRL